MSNFLIEPQFQVRVFDPSNINTCVGVFDDLVSVTYRKQRNHVGMAVLTAPENHGLFDLFASLGGGNADIPVEIYISYPNLATSGVVTWNVTWASDFFGLYLDRQIVTDGDGNIYYQYLVPSMEEPLSRHTVAYPQGSLSKTYWLGEELAIIANDIVIWNCTSSGTLGNGRIRDAAEIHGMDDAGAIGGTDVVNYTIGTGRNVLEVLQELAPICGFDFAVVRGAVDPTILEVTQYTGQLGTDKSASIFFAQGLNNCNGSSFNGDRLREKTVAIVGGQGEGSGRVFTVRTGANHGAHNDYEFFVDARTSSTAAEREALGDTKLGELMARSQLSTNVAASRGYVYKRDYGLGDLVSIRFSEIVTVRIIDRVEVTFGQDQQAKIQVDFADVT